MNATADVLTIMNDSFYVAREI